MNAIPKEVEGNIREYFKENLPRYQVMEIRKNPTTQMMIFYI